jgi:hypothetical protein
MQQIERLDQLDVREIHILPVIYEDGIHIADVIWMVLEELINRTVKSTMDDLQ